MNKNADAYVLSGTLPVQESLFTLASTLEDAYLQLKESLKPAMVNA